MQWFGGETRKNLAELGDGPELGVTGLLVRSVGVWVGNIVGEGDSRACGVVGWRGRGGRTVVREELYRHVVAFAPGRWDVDVVASVVLTGGTEVPAVDTVGREGTSSSGRFICHHSASWWRERGGVKVEGPIKSGFG